MNRKSLTLTVIVTYLLGPVCGQLAQAQNRVGNTPVGSTNITPVVVDVALTPTGTLQGQLISQTGQAIDGAQVTVLQNNKTIATAHTTKAGTFTANGLNSGLYEIQSGQKSMFVRAWTPQVAPQTAKNGIVMVQDGTAMRGQFGYVDPINASAIILGITGVTLSAITLGQVNDIEDRLRRPVSP